MMFFPVVARSVVLGECAVSQRGLRTLRTRPWHAVDYRVGQLPFPPCNDNLLWWLLNETHPPLHAFVNMKQTRLIMYIQSLDCTNLL